MGSLYYVFNLRDAELERVLRKAPANVLAHDAVPVVSSPDRSRWEETKRYGDTPDAIIDGVVAEWKDDGSDPGFMDVWFARRETLD